MERPLWKIIISLFLIGVICLVSYVLYVVLSYDRIPDNEIMEIDSNGEVVKAEIGKEYSAVSQNVGFGAYNQEFTFFMDGGKGSVAESATLVIDNLTKATDMIKTLNPDFLLLQEVDIDSTRSHHINEYLFFSENFNNYSRTYAINYDSAFLYYPLKRPHGASKSSLATFSKVNIDSALRRSLPVSESLSKFLDLDRCYTVSRIKCDNEKELVLYNVHSSAYGAGDEIRTAQMTMLFSDMEKEYKKGNYVICGGDFNHDFTGTSTMDLNGGKKAEFGWAQPFPEDLIPEGISRCIDYKNGLTIPSCRNCDVPYETGNFTIIVDGFLVSDNVECVSVENIMTNFEYSDHNPVYLKFKLK